MRQASYSHGMIMGGGTLTPRLSPLQITSHNPGETRRLGHRLGKLVQGGEVILLVGEIGTGKTCLVQGLAWGLGIKGYASSPSFVVIKEYQGRIPLYHIDLYRLEHLEEVGELGLDDYLYGKGVCAVEWAERGLSLFPREHLLISISYLSDTERRLLLEPSSDRYREILARLERGRAFPFSGH